MSSTRLIFGARTGNRIADRLREDMTPGQRLSTTEIREKFFANHVSASNLSEALRLLEQVGEVQLEAERSGGRPRVMVIRLEGASNAAGGPSPSRRKGGGARKAQEARKPLRRGPQRKA